MCGRYHITIDENFTKEIEDILNNMPVEGMKMDSDVYPSHLAPVLLQKNHSVCFDSMQWGFPSYSLSKLIINARAESLFERKMFRESTMTKRILIPSDYFYEWNADKVKYSCCRQDKKPMFFAGLWNTYEQKDKFVIITTQANDSVKKIHHRMPLIVEESQIRTWLLLEGNIQKILSSIPVPLNCNTEYEQLTLDL